MLEINKQISWLVLVPILLGFAFAFALVQPVVAQDEQEAQDTTIVELVTEPVSAPASITYRFVAQPCDSLTKLVRRALLTYDLANNEIELTKAGIVFAETNIVQLMGAHWLDIGEEVAIDGELVERFALESLGLDEATLAAWQYYVPFVDFDIADIQQPEDVDEIIDEIGGENGGEDETEDEQANDSSTAWWFAGLGTVALVWYLLWRREED